ncbi:MAG: FGGY family carbohydrate kinase [Planctomycetia bacterium]|nr:FGGY family carbohydrate kinase [Planctomycetia bacterium]
MKYVLGIDFGGGASKATLLAENGKIVATNTVEYPTSYPQVGFAEQNPWDWYDATCRTIGEILEKSGVHAENIVAVSLDAATHTAVLTDENFQPIRPAIYWTDSRSTEEVRFLRENYLDVIEREVLHKPDTIWTLPQLMWVQKHEPEVWRKTRRIMFAKDFVRHQLTDDFVTDVIEAQGSMFFDYTRMTWSETLCGLLGMRTDSEMLPKLVQPTDIVGEITAKAASQTGLQAGTPVLCGTTDTVMEVYASGAVAQGQMTIKLATAGRICVVTDRAYPNPYLINYSHVAQGLWYPGTATKSCAASFRWYRDTFGGEFQALAEGAASVPVGCGGLMYHPYLNGELTPYADPKLCGSFIGVRAGHTKNHFTRAVFEGVAMSMLDCRRALESIHIPHDEVAVAIGGGAQSPIWRQILADALSITLIQKENSDSSFGSAMMAGVAIEIFTSLADALKCCSKEVSRTFPVAENTEKYAEMFVKYKAVHDALAPIYHG